jgi:hypothetical protein
MRDIFIHPFPGRQIRLERLASVEVLSPVELAKLALSDFFLLASDLFQPLSLDLEFTYCEPGSGYPLNTPTPLRPFWLLYCRDLSSEIDINPAWEDEELVMTEDLLPDTILDWISTVIEQQRDEAVDFLVSWREMLFSANRVRLPVAADQCLEKNLHIRADLSTLEYPIERRNNMLWVSGPLMRKTLTAPISAKLTNDAGFFTLDLWLHWSLWADELGEGNQQVKHAINKLIDREWNLSS